MHLTDFEHRLLHAIKEGDVPTVSMSLLADVVQRLVGEVTQLRAQLDELLRRDQDTSGR